MMVSEHVFYPEKLTSKYPYAPDGKPMFGPDTDWPDPWSAIAAMAAVTTRLTFVTGVYILPLRHPLEVAKIVGTVAVLSRNRVVLGVGSGWMREEFDALGEDFQTRGRRLDEMVEILAKVWAGGMVEHHGRFYQFDRLQMAPVPTQRIPIYVGGTSTPAMRRAARLGDGWIGAGNAPDEVPAVMQKLKAFRREAGRDHLPFETIVALTSPPDIELFRRLEDEGVTTFVNWPFVFTLGPGSSIDAKRRALEQYANDVIARAR
jgi:probable F420-dependent oxidoreductase